MVMYRFVCFYYCVIVVPAIGHSFNSLSRFSTSSVIRLVEAINSLSEVEEIRKDSTM
jgi:hypothetical protein